MEDHLADLLLAWEEAWEAGRDLTAAELCSDCPELVEHLQSQIDALKKMAWMDRDHAIGPTGPTFLPPKLLANRYEVGELIAEGGFGCVYKGFDTTMRHSVAIKFAKHRLGHDSSHLLQEARHAAKLRHPNIVTVFDVGNQDGQWYILSELVEGHSLAEMLESACLTPNKSAKLLAKVADALHHAHEQGFVHRDIKPANILTDQHGKPRITDFGIATTFEELAQGKSVTGTLPYMAPEQLSEQNHLLDCRVDVYALGVVLFQSLTGRLPFDGASPTEVKEKILLQQPPMLCSVDPKIPKQLEAICLKCLAKHPAERFATAEELANALRAWRDNRNETSAWKWAALGLILISTGLYFGSQIVNSSDSPQEAIATKNQDTSHPATVQNVAPLKTESPPYWDGKTAIWEQQTVQLRDQNFLWVFEQNVKDIQFSFGENHWTSVENFVQAGEQSLGMVNDSRIADHSVSHIFVKYRKGSGDDSPIYAVSISPSSSNHPSSLDGLLPKPNPPKESAPTSKAKVIRASKKVFLSNYNEIWVMDNTAEKIWYSFDQENWKPLAQLISTPILCRGSVADPRIRASDTERVFVKYTDESGTESPIYEVLLSEAINPPKGLGEPLSPHDFGVKISLPKLPPDIQSKDQLEEQINRSNEVLKSVPFGPPSKKK